MQQFFRIVFLLYLLSLTSVCRGQAPRNVVLSRLIDSLKTEDQKPVTLPNPDSAAAAYQRVIRRNFPEVKNILDQHGFPGYNLVGTESSHNYWLLVQHSDFNIPFQKKALARMKQQVNKKNASGQDYAYLVDRIELNEGRKQLYGTQIIMGGGGTKLKPCRDIRNLDKRRKQVGLTPIKEYLQKADSYFYELNKDRMKKPAADSLPAQNIK